jgi:antitoxin VapB
MAKAKIFQSGNSQAVRLPKAFRFNTEEVEIYRRGAEIVLRECQPRLSQLLAALPPLPEDFVEPEDSLPQERPPL